MIPDVSITLTGWTAIWVIAAAAYGTLHGVLLLLQMPRAAGVGGGG